MREGATIGGGICTTFRFRTVSRRSVVPEGRTEIECTTRRVPSVAKEGFAASFEARERTAATDVFFLTDGGVTDCGSTRLTIAAAFGVFRF